MPKKLKNIDTLKPRDLTNQEVVWFNKFMEFALKDTITEEDIVFTKLNGKHLTYFRIPHQLRYEFGLAIPKRFLQSGFIVLGIPGEGREDESFARIKFVYWYLANIKDILGYKDFLNRFFSSVFYGDNSEYDESAEGYKVLDLHLEEKCNSWTPIGKMFLLGFAGYLGLLQKSSLPPLVTIFEGLKDKSLKCFGITKASREPFGKVSHYEKLGFCWNCGDEIDAPGGLCKDCYKYWDEKTR